MGTGPSFDSFPQGCFGNWFIGPREEVMMKLWKVYDDDDNNDIQRTIFNQKSSLESYRLSWDKKDLNGKNIKLFTHLKVYVNLLIVSTKSIEQLAKPSRHNTTCTKSRKNWHQHVEKPRKYDTTGTKSPILLH